MERLICVAIGYLFGLFQTGYIYGMINHVDIRKHGSGNAGTTNALRTLGWKAGAITFIGDCLKCVLAVLLVRFIFANSSHVELLAIYAGLGAVLGHNFPFYLNFKGGKGILCGVTIAGVIDWRIAVIIFGAFAVVYAITQYVSLSSLVGSILFAVFFVVLHHDNLLVMLGGVIIGLLAVYMHRTNIVRLIKGTESKTNLFAKGKQQGS